MSVETFCSSPEGMTQSHENIGQILKQRMRSSRSQQNIICVDRLQQPLQKESQNILLREYFILLWATAHHPQAEVENCW